MCFLKQYLLIKLIFILKGIDYIIYSFVFFCYIDFQGFVVLRVVDFQVWGDVRNLYVVIVWSVLLMNYCVTVTFYYRTNKFF